MVEDVYLYLINPSPFNPRKSADPARQHDLVESIRLHGIHTPLLVRPMPDGAVELIAGSRRFAAAGALELETVPCLVRPMTDEQARELALVDNLQREDVPALEEADAYEALRRELGTAAAIAARVGKPVEHVTKRLRLVALGAHTRQALAERLITIDHALLLARVGAEEEEAALKWCLDRTAGSTVKVEKVIADRIERREKMPANIHYGYSEPESVLKLKFHIEQSVGRKLSVAPWPLDDGLLVPSAGTCAGCPSNTAANDSLFGDLNIAEATCSDGICFEAKRAAFVHRKILEAGGEKTPRLSGKSSSVRPKMVLHPKAYGPDEKPGEHYMADPAKVLKKGQWVEAKPASCGNTVAGVTVDWEEVGYYSKRAARKPGTLLTVCTTEGCKAHPKSYEKSSKDVPGAQSSKAEQERLEKNKAREVEENMLRMALVAAALEQMRTIPETALREIVASKVPKWAQGPKIWAALLPEYQKTLKAGAVDSVEFARVAALAEIEYAELHMDTYDGLEEDVKVGRAGLLKKVRGWGYAGPDPWSKPKAEKPAKKTVAKKTAVKKAAGKPAKKVAAKKKGGAA